MSGPTTIAHCCCSILLPEVTKWLSCCWSSASEDGKNSVESSIDDDNADAEGLPPELEVPDIRVD